MAEISLSDDVVVESCLSTIRGTVRLIRKEIDTPDGKALRDCVSFATNRGKGSGAQVIAVDEFPAFVAALREAHDSGFETAETVAAYRPAAEVAMDTLAMDGETDDDGNPVGEPDAITFRVRGGKGSKPARIPLSECEDVITFLENRAPRIAAACAQLRAAEAAEAAKPAKAPKAPKAE